MEEIQSWWEVPAVAHFCYVFRSAFNMIFFEIAELESALLNIQDPDMSISLDQLIIRLLQGCLDEESVTETNWEEKLHELFNENFEDGENPFDDSQSFFQLTPRSKIEILLRLCEFRLDVEGALEAIKNISSEDMQAKCMGKDSLNNTYWYFCDERLYKEDPSSGKKPNQNQKKKEVKNSVSKSNRPVNTREKRTKANSDVNKSWSIACFNVSDWEKLLKTFSKSKNVQEKELAKEIKNHLPVVEERVSEKDRLLRKRFLELAPKRSSSRISKVQEKKKLEEIKAQEEARIAKLEAEREQARKEALRLKEEKESRQKRAEMRHQAVEERARRALLREMARGSKSEDSDSSNDPTYSAFRESKNYSVRSKIQRNLHTIVEHSEESETTDSEEHDTDSDYEASNVCYQRTRKKKHFKQHTDNSWKLTEQDNSKRCLRTYSNYKEQSRNNQIRSSSRLQGKQKTVKYRFDTDESEQSENDEAPMKSDESEDHTSLQQNRWKSEDQSESSNDESDDKDNSSSNESNSDSDSDKSHNNVKSKDSISMQNNSKNSSTSNSNESQGTRLSLPRVTIYKTTLLKDSSDASKWNAVLDAKGQKLHILNGSYDNLSSKKLKLEEGKIFRTSTPNMKSSLLKENHIYQPNRQTPFITYGKIIPSSPSIVRLDFRKPPPNPQVSS